MAYEDMTYEVIIQRMIDRVREEYPNLDTREGSILFNALAPAAIELAVLYTQLDNALAESFVSTASREYLLLACQQMGMDISTFDASAGTHKGVFNVQVPIGSRWNLDLYNYTVTEYIDAEDGLYAYKLQCETTGASPNDVVGDLTPITNVPSGLSQARIIECVIDGENETPDEGVRNAYYSFVSGTVTDGNINQYKGWCDSYDGVGNFKIFPLWDGANTVKVSILSASNRVASPELIEEFQEYLDPDVSGMGDGVAPIGAFVTVTTATEVPLAINASVKMKSGFTDTSIIDTALTKYFQDIAYEKSQVSYMTVGANILGVEGVESISNLTINGGTADINIGNEEIAVLGVTDWTVV